MPNGTGGFNVLGPDASVVLTLGEGNTPLLDAPGAASYGGLDRLAFKHQGFNPTGSLPRVLKILIGINVGVFLIELLTKGNGDFIYE